MDPSSGNSPKTSSITRFLEKAPQPIFVTYATFVAFATYFCMYAFRKPFSVARFEGEEFSWVSGEVTLKSAIVISQIFGYAISKYIGIKVCSEVLQRWRAWLMVALVIVAELALLAYAIVPGSWKVVPIFLNGIPLGMVWGLVVWYLEGRRTSEILLAGLSCSFIMSSGIVKEFGVDVMNGEVASIWSQVPLIGSYIAPHLTQISESWMPFVTGLHFLPPYIFFVWLLSRIPVPDREDVTQRSPRTRMDGQSRWAFIRQFSFGLGLLCFVYFSVTAYRDFRDNFLVDILADLGMAYDDSNKSTIAMSETIVAFVVMFAMGCLSVVKDNRKGLTAAFALMGSGCLILVTSSLLSSSNAVSPFHYIVLTGLGSYFIYVPFNSMLFDRLIAFTRFSGTAVFAIYLADSIGYTGSVILMLAKDQLFSNIGYAGFFNVFSLVVGVVSLAGLILALIYFLRKKSPDPIPSNSDDS